MNQVSIQQVKLNSLSLRGVKVNNYSLCQLPTKRPRHQPLAQPLDLPTRCHLLIANPLHILHDVGELLLESERREKDFKIG